MKYLMGIDNGGTFSKAAIFDELGNQISVASLGTEMITPQPGFSERDLEELWKVNIEVIRQTILKSGVDPSDIAGVSFSGHGKGLYLVDYDNNPLYNGILSTDNRANFIVKKWKDEKITAKVFDITYQEVLASQPVSLLAWLKKYDSNILKETKYIFSVKDFIRFKLTGEAFGEFSDFSGGNLVNLKSMEYDPRLLELFELSEVYEKLPQLKRSTDICGYITKEASELTLLPQGTPVTAGMFDVDACGIAAGLCSEEEICMIAGTWSINEFISKRPITDGSVSLNSLFCIPEYYLIEESSPTSAGNLEWFIKNLMSDEEKEYTEKEESIYDYINSMVESVDPTETKLIFLPFLNGSNEDNFAKGTFIGLTAFHKRKHLLRAVYEGVVFSHFDHINRLLMNREKPKSIRLAGGASKSDVWVQIFADVLQIPIDVISDKELGAQGAAIAAGIGVGIYCDYKDGISKTVKISKTVYPRKKYKEIYEKKYLIYRKVNNVLTEAWSSFES